MVYAVLADRRDYFSVVPPKVPLGREIEEVVHIPGFEESEKSITSPRMQRDSKGRG